MMMTGRTAAGLWEAVPARRSDFAVIDVLAIAGLMALAAQARIPVPFSPAPVTLQTFIVLIAAFLVGAPRASLGMALYVGLGVLGVPLFAVSSGATLGYLLAFLFVPHVVARFRNALAGLAAATALIYLLGSAWLAIALGLTVAQAVAVGVLPFLPGDAVKIAAAWALAGRLTRR